MLTGAVKSSAAETYDEELVRRSALLVAAEFQKLCKPLKGAPVADGADRSAIMKANLEKVGDSARLTLGRALKLSFSIVEGFDAEKGPIMDVLAPLVDGVEKCTEFLGGADYEVRIKALDEAGQLAFAQDFTAYQDYIEGNTMRKLKVAALCKTFLDAQQKKDRLVTRERVTSVRSDESVLRFAAAAQAQGNAKLAETKRQEAEKLAAEMMEVSDMSSQDSAEKSRSPPVIPAVDPTMEATAKAEEQRLADEARKRAFRARLAAMAHYFSEDSTVQSAAKSVADEHAARTRAEKLIVLQDKLAEATKHFEQAQATRAQSAVRADQEAAALTFAKQVLPKYLEKIPADLRREYLAWGRGLSAGIKSGDAAAIETLNTIIMTHGFTDSTPLAEIERKASELLHAGQHEVGFKVLKYLAMKYVGNMEGSVSMLQRAEAQEGEAQVILSALESEVQKLQVE